MSKAVISNRIVLPVKDKAHEEALLVNLTYKLIDEYRSRLSQKEIAEIIKTYLRMPRGYYSIPSGRMDLIPPEYTIEDNRVSVPAVFPKHSITLRPSQQAVYDHINDSCIINAPVSWGKTYTAIAIAAKLGLKTLVITHTTVLRDQWIKDIKNVLGITPGVIGAGKWEGLDSPIVVSNVQTLRKDIPRISKMFGTTIVDECLDYETIIDTDQGKMKLGAIVNNERPVMVRSLNLETGKDEYRPILRYFKNSDSECLKIVHSVGSIKATDNHNIYIEENNKLIKKQAKEIIVGDRLVLTSNNHKASHKLNNKYNDLLLGMLLGDGNLSNSVDNIRLRITHGEDQLDYLLYKEKLLSQAVSGEIMEGKSGYGTKAVYYFQTVTFNDDLNLYKKIYVDGSKKNITEDLTSLLSKRSWSFIYQDDGSISTKSITFSFCEFNLDTLNRLKNNFKTLFDIDEDLLYTYTCTKGFNYLKIRPAGAQKFLTEIKNYIHPTLYYKFGDFIDIANSAVFEDMPALTDLVMDYYTRPVTAIYPSTLTNGFRYNIEVENNHNYYANGVLVSNCHHIPATTFSEILDSLWSRYKIGLSGTVQRKDRKHVLFTDFFGPIMYKPEAENRVNPNILIVKSKLRILSANHWADAITELCNNEDYRNLVHKLADTMADKGHKVLVIGERRNFLESCCARSGDRACLITGDVTDFAKRESLMQEIANSHKDILYGSRAIFSEGVSLNELSCLILASPINNVLNLEQLIGRIQRIVEGKRTPVVIDLNLADNTSKKQAQTRKSYYLGKGYKIFTLDEK